MRFRLDELRKIISEEIRKVVRNNASSREEKQDVPLKNGDEQLKPKSTYKIYGPSNDAPAHTRFGGKLYVAPDDTEFGDGDRAEMIPPEGPLQVHDKKTDHTQLWTTEAVKAFVDRLDLPETPVRRKKR